ncbi:MAG: DUF1598 domain-containing protein [Verrucomicrobia bacterium]|nr:DUF1598 domain-containing protein [Verrucomicrobiota bacterium]
MNSHLSKAIRMNAPTQVNRRTFLRAAAALALAAAGKQCVNAGAEVVDAEPRSITSERICLSLRTLFTMVSDQQRAGRSVTETAAWLGGLERVDGYLLHEQHRDVILFGRKAPFQQCLHLDDLAVNIANVWGGQPAPYCSLDPSQGEVLALDRLFREIGLASSLDAQRKLFDRLKAMRRPQTVLVGGVPCSSRHAHVMIDSDYRLKKLCAGLETVPGVSSHLDRMLSLVEAEVRNHGRMPALGVSMARFWFHLAEGHPKFLMDEDIVMLDQCSVVVLTERQRATADGQRFDSGEDDPVGKAFAEEFSRAFPSLTSKVPVFAALENLFRLSALLRALHFKSDAERAGLSLGRQFDAYSLLAPRPMPPDLPGVTNGNEAFIPVQLGSRTGTLTVHPFVCGGVGMDMNLTDASWQKDTSESLRAFKLAALRRRPDHRALSWTIV